MTALAVDAGLDLVVPPPALCTDNAAMVAWAGLERLQLGLTDGLDFAPRPRWPLDQVTKAATRRRRAYCSKRSVNHFSELSKFVLADDILDAVFEVGDVVDFHDDDLVCLVPPQGRRR